MTVIKNGFGGEILDIRVYAVEDSDRAEIWTDMRIDLGRAIVEQNSMDKETVRQEYLHYASLEELIKLRNEINTAIKEMAGL